MNAGERDPELDSLLSAPPDELPDMGALFDGVKSRVDAAEKSKAYRIQTQPTSRRRLMGVASFGMVVLVTLLTGRRADLDTYPPVMMAIMLTSLAVLFGLAIWVALRPVHRPPLAQWQTGGLALLTIAAACILAVAPGLHDHVLARPEVSLVAHASPCMIYGFVFGLPVYGALRFLDPHSTPMARVLAAAAAGLAGNTVLELHCPIGGPAHLMAAHASVVALYILGVFLIERIFRSN